MKPSGYFFHGMKMCVFYRVHARLIFTSYDPLTSFNSKSCLRNSYRSFQWNLPVIVPMTWRGSYYTEVTLDHFLPELWPFVSFSHFINRSSCLRNSSFNFKGFWWIFPDIVPMTDLKMIIFYRGDWTDFYQSYGPLPFISIEKPCQHNILITTWARILIFGIWPRINIYITLLTFEKFHDILSYAPFTILLITIEKSCQQVILRTAWARHLILGIQVGLVCWLFWV